MKKLFAGFLILLIGLSAVAMWLKPSRVRMPGVVRSADWIRAEYLNTASSGSCFPAFRVCRHSIGMSM
ncbi:MAG: hypothetical protein WCR06_09950 [bacterium]